ncbi:thioesterase domain-containing protein [Microbispora sp. H13382]|uniref:thioesterase domain-containing protein n=1 Tax=Microbispora sp. H13382 TaxID=2729112 RepID=UPI001C71986D|nr:thioesterase domain-containing protein [Microbispora sp. H13382]
MEHRPIFCWPGLGGYPMNLRTLAKSIDGSRPFYGIQAKGINEGETPYATIGEMAAADADSIRRVQPVGPYTLWGYSFGARVAFETAYQLERSGETVDHLFLIAPGSPVLREAADLTATGEDIYRDRAFVTILFSVFAGTINGPVLEECLRATKNKRTFTDFILSRYGELDRGLVERIISIVRLTYSFEYTFHELVEKQVSAPITVFKARGDDYSFLEGCITSLANPPVVVDLESDHYGLLKDPGVKELAYLIGERMRADVLRREAV